MPTLLLTVLFILIDPLAWAQEWTQEETERFQFFADCQPMRVAVTVINANTDENLEEQEATLHAALESRLRSARLYHEQGRNHLKVFVLRYYDNGVDGTGASTMIMAYSKVLHDPATSLLRYGITFQSVLYHRNSESYTHIAQATDQFIADYLRVNEPACVAR